MNDSETIDGLLIANNPTLRGNSAIIGALTVGGRRDAFARNAPAPLIFKGFLSGGVKVQ